MSCGGEDEDEDEDENDRIVQAFDREICEILELGLDWIRLDFCEFIGVFIKF